MTAGLTNYKIITKKLKSNKVIKKGSKNYTVLTAGLTNYKVITKIWKSNKVITKGFKNYNSRAHKLEGYYKEIKK